MTTDLRKELRQLVMESYDRGVADATKAACAAAVAAVAAEREACAKVCDAAAKKMDDEGEGPTGYIAWVTDCAAAIRARGNK